jgi:hypothetical protein
VCITSVVRVVNAERKIRSHNTIHTSEEVANWINGGTENPSPPSESRSLISVKE